MKQARLAAEKAAKEGDQPNVDGKDHEADGNSPDDQGRHKLGQPSALMLVCSEFVCVCHKTCCFAAVLAAVLIGKQTMPFAVSEVSHAVTCH